MASVAVTFGKRRWIMDFNENEKIELLASLKGIDNSLNQLTALIKSIIEPGVMLRHFKKGAAIRVDDSQSAKNNKTF